VDAAEIATELEAEAGRQINSGCMHCIVPSAVARLLSSIVIFARSLLSSASVQQVVLRCCAAAKLIGKRFAGSYLNAVHWTRP